MTRQSPLHELHLDAGASFLPYGPPAPPGAAAQVPETFGPLELEYAAIRKSAAIIDCPQRATIRITGEERLDFLNRMLTQDVKSLAPYATTNAMLVTRQGRLIADLTLINLPDQTLVDVDILAATATLETLDQFLFAEDVTLEDVTETTHRLSLHGPNAIPLLAAVSEPAPGAPPLDQLKPNAATQLTIARRPATVHRADHTAEVGLHLTIAAEHTQTIYTAITDAGIAPEIDHVEAKEKGIEHPFRLRRAGWHAFNIARLEAGTPLFNIDFGPDSLPAETGVLHDRVSFTKGCYPGQEVVARMNNLGHPKQVLVAIRVTPPEGTSHDPTTPDRFQPMTGAALYEAEASEKAKPVGAVTSSTRSPMCSDAIIALAQLKWDHAQPDTALEVQTPAGRASASVQPNLRAWPGGELNAQL